MAIINILDGLKNYFRVWLFRRKIESGTITLNRHRIFIIPTKQGFALAFVLVLMLLGDINYSLSLGYALTFLLAMMGLMTMLYTFRNLAQLEIRPGRADAVFSGEKARFLLHFHNPGKWVRHQLFLAKNGAGLLPVCFDLADLQDSEIAFYIPATRRGWLELGELKLYTEFPLGLFHAWSYLHFDTRCLIYPKPLHNAPLPPGNRPDGAGKNVVSGDDDFSGLRNYVAGDALPRIDWKVFAREQGLQVKQFSTQTGEDLWLDFSEAPDHTEEEKLARMTRWILDAESQGLRYGLRLSDSELRPDKGILHRDECLRRVALFDRAEQ